MATRLPGILVAALLAALAAGCGGSGARTFSGQGTSDAGGGGELDYALAAPAGPLDPLAAADYSQQTVVSQLYEPLVAALDEPYGGARGRRGLALGWHSSRDLRVWSFRLRPGIQFQNGEALSAATVAANAERWRTDSRGQLLLPSLLAADAPRPDLVRMIFSVPQSRLPSLLDDPRLGIVAPEALAAVGSGLDLERARRAGTGPFEVRSRSPERLTLARVPRWWGSSAGLGPALDRIVFTTISDAAGRVQALRDGDVRVAAELSAADAVALSHDPLITVVGADGVTPLGFERSVRGIEGFAPVPLNGVWLALLPET